MHLIRPESDQTFAMEWHGRDFVAACRNNLVQTEFDMCSLYLQYIWTFQTLGDRLNIVNTDMHAANVWIRVAPYGGHFLIRFQLKFGGSTHVVSLRTRLMLTIGDWGIYIQSSHSDPPHMALNKHFASERGSRSISRTNSRNSNSMPSSPSSTRPSQQHSVLRTTTTLCSPVQLATSWQIVVNSTPMAPKLSEKYSEACTLPKIGVAHFLHIADTFAHVHEHEYISVDSRFSADILAVINKHPVSIKPFQQREYIEWVHCEEQLSQLESIAPPTLIEVAEPSSPPKRILPFRRAAKQRSPPANPSTKTLPATTTTTMANDEGEGRGRRRGRPPKNGIAAMSHKERNDRRRERAAVESLQNLRAVAELREQRILGNRMQKQSVGRKNLDPISMPFDTTLVTVKPSFLWIGDKLISAGLGVFALRTITAGTRITSYSGAWCQVDNPPIRDWHHTHLLSLGATREPTDVLDGLRFPQAGCGVASLINSCRGTTSTANVKFEKTNEVETKSAVAISIRDIEAGDELLADYEPVLLEYH